ncbi:MAG: DUF2842 domain-containing protein [Methylocella sp.]
MRRSSRKFTSASAIIGFVPVYALVAMAIAQTRPLRQASCIMQILCYAASAWPGSCRWMPVINGKEKPGPGT